MGTITTRTARPGTALARWTLPVIGALGTLILCVLVPPLGIACGAVAAVALYAWTRMAWFEDAFGTMSARARLSLIACAGAAALYLVVSIVSGIVF